MTPLCEARGITYLTISLTNTKNSVNETRNNIMVLAVAHNSNIRGRKFTKLLLQGGIFDDNLGANEPLN